MIRVVATHLPTERGGQSSKRELILVPTNLSPRLQKHRRAECPQIPTILSVTCTRLLLNFNPQYRPTQQWQALWKWPLFLGATTHATHDSQSIPQFKVVRKVSEYFSLRKITGRLCILISYCCYLLGLEFEKATFSDHSRLASGWFMEIR